MCVRVNVPMTGRGLKIVFVTLQCARRNVAEDTINVYDESRIIKLAFVHGSYSENVMPNFPGDRGFTRNWSLTAPRVVKSTSFLVDVQTTKTRDEQGLQ